MHLKDRGLVPAMCLGQLGNLLPHVASHGVELLRVLEIGIDEARKNHAAKERELKSKAGFVLKALDRSVSAARYSIMDYA